MDSPELRPVSMADDDLIFRVFASSRAEEMKLVAWDETAKLGFLHMQFLAQQAHYRTNFPLASHDIILVGGDPVGRVYVDRRETEIRILDITLLPEARGQGIGYRLLQDLMQEAETVHKKLSIHVDHSSPSLGWFERLGFVCAGGNGISSLMEWNPVEG